MFEYRLKVLLANKLIGDRRAQYATIDCRRVALVYGYLCFMYYAIIRQHFFKFKF